MGLIRACVLAAMLFVPPTSSVARGAVTPSTTCSIGRALIGRLAERDRSLVLKADASPLYTLDEGGELPEATLDLRTPSSLFIACPALTTQLPDPVRLAGAKDLENVSLAIPVADPPGAPPLAHEVTWLSAPIAYHGTIYVFRHILCSGFCGGGWMHRFQRVQGRWREMGQPRNLWVS